MNTTNSENDQAAIDNELSTWAESDAAIEALKLSDAPRDTEESRIALDAFQKAGRPRLDGTSSGSGRAPRRQVRLPADLNRALDTYASEHNTTASEIMRQAISRFLSDSTAA